MTSATAAAADEQSKQPPNHAYPPPPPLYSNSYPSGYPTPLPPYQPYPPPYPHYTAPPPAAYYSHHYHHPSVAAFHHEPPVRFTFARFILITMITLLVGAIAMSFITWLIFGAQIPQFSVKSLTVPSFNASDNSLNADWDANVTVKNSNEKLEIYFERLEGVIVYKNSILGLDDVDPFHLATRSEVTFSVRVSTKDPQRESLTGNYHELVEERRRRAVRFGLRMIATVAMRSGTMWRRQASLRVFCEDLEVRFVGPSGPGNLGLGRERQCLIYA